MGTTDRNKNKVQGLTVYSETKNMFFWGDPKTKFSRLFFSAVRRPTIKKTLPDIAPVRRLTSDLGQML